MINKKLFTGALWGTMITTAIFLVILRPFFEKGADNNAQGGAQKDEPLYWVAPMDSNYRRDKPGKSPMGMELVPVYAEQAAGGSSSPGAIRISPEVVNNLGVRTEKAELKKLQRTIKTVGYVGYSEDLLIHIHPRVEGWVEKLFVKAEGDPVKKGQPIYEIYSPELVNAQEELLLALERNNSRLIQAAEHRLKALQLPEEVIRGIKSRRKVVQNVRFYSPQDGVVDNLNIRQGFYVKPGNTIMSIGALDEVWVETEIFERQAPWVEVDMPVSMTLNYLPGVLWQGKIDYIHPTLDPKTRTVKLRLKFINRDDQLKPNMFAQVIIHANSDKEALVVPRSSVIRTGAQDRVVIALDEGRFKSVSVKLGAQNESYMEILSGIHEGESVVTSAQFLIDSESSKTSDFLRMEGENMQPSSVWTGAKIIELKNAERAVKVSHEAIDAWNWSAMQMDLDVAQAVDFDRLAKGQFLHIQITRDDNNQLAITDIHIMDNDSKGHDSKMSDMIPTATVSGTINQVNQAERILNISREAIEKWGRPAATMDFLLDESIDISALKPNQRVVFSFQVGDNLLITKVEPMETNLETEKPQLKGSKND